MSGVISERQSEVVKKWLFLGDLPIFGALFRASQSERTKEELVVVVTPQCLMMSKVVCMDMGIIRQVRLTSSKY